MLLPTVLVTIKHMPQQVGSALMLLILDSLKITRPDGSAVPAFRQETSVITRQSPHTKLFKVHKQGHIVADPEVVRQLEENKEVRAHRIGVKIVNVTAV